MEDCAVAAEGYCEVDLGGGLRCGSGRRWRIWWGGWVLVDGEGEGGVVLLGGGLFEEDVYAWVRAVDVSFLV